MYDEWAMSNDDRHRDIGEAIDSLTRTRTERGCLQSRLTKFATQMEDAAKELRSRRLIVMDGKIVRHGAVSEGALPYPDRQELLDAIQQHDAAIKQYDDARQRCFGLGLSDLVENFR